MSTLKHFLVGLPPCWVAAMGQGAAAAPQAGLCWLSLSPGSRQKVNQGPSALELPARGPEAYRPSDFF